MKYGPGIGQIKFQNELEAQKGKAGGLATLDTDGKVEITQAPPALINSFYSSAETDEGNLETVLTETEAYKGDILSFTELKKSYILAENPYSLSANWKELKTTAAYAETAGNLTGCPFRVGARYMQMSEEDNPNTLWPTTTWAEITTLNGRLPKIDSNGTPGAVGGSNSHGHGMIHKHATSIVGKVGVSDFLHGGKYGNITESYTIKKNLIIPTTTEDNVFTSRHLVSAPLVATASLDTDVKNDTDEATIDQEHFIVKLWKRTA